MKPVCIYFGKRFRKIYLLCLLMNLSWRQINMLIVSILITTSASGLLFSCSCSYDPLLRSFIHFWEILSSTTMSAYCVVPNVDIILQSGPFSATSILIYGIWNFQNGPQPQSWIWSNRKLCRSIRRPPKLHTGTRHEQDRINCCRVMAIWNFPKCVKRAR